MTGVVTAEYGDWKRAVERTSGWIRAGEDPAAAP